MHHLRKTMASFIALGLITLVTAQAFAKEITIRGRLQKTVEAGGWLIVADKQKYLLLNAQRFQTEKWFRESTEVEADGETKPDVMTIYMEGTPFEVKTMRPLTSEGEASQEKVTDGRPGTRVLVSGDSIVQAQPDTAVI